MSARKHKIAVVAGDGIGPEVTEVALEVLGKVAGKRQFEVELRRFPFGGEHYLKTGETLSDASLAELRQSDVIYLGAVGSPKVKPGILEKGVLLKLRFAFDQYINLRPVKLYPGVECPIKGKGPEHLDYVVVRENTGDMYAGIGGTMMEGTDDEVAVQEMAYNHKQVARCLRYAFELAAARPRKTLALIGKSNVLTYVFKLWDRVFHSMGEAEFPQVKREYYHVDAACMMMVKQPERFDVMVTTNMFGDIITDLGAMIQGGLGIAAGGNINPVGISMFEPMGGSAPKYTGKNVINPIAAIGAAGMMLDTLGERAAAAAVEKAIMATTPKMKSQAAGKMGFGTTEVGDLVAGMV